MNRFMHGLAIFVIAIAVLIGFLYQYTSAAPTLGLGQQGSVDLSSLGSPMLTLSGPDPFVVYMGNTHRSGSYDPQGASRYSLTLPLTNDSFSVASESGVTARITDRNRVVAIRVSFTGGMILIITAMAAFVAGAILGVYYLFRP